MVFLRTKNRCGGCYSPDRQCSKKCSIFACEQVRNRYHHTCTEFPCKRLRQLDERYRKKYGMNMIDNLEKIRSLGIREFIKMERERWTCKACGGIINVHKGKCSDCGKERE